MKKIAHTLIITALIMLSACGGRQTQTEGADAAAVDTKEVTARRWWRSMTNTSYIAHTYAYPIPT